MSADTARISRADDPDDAAERLHDLPLPVTWDLLGLLRRRVPPCAASRLLAIHEDVLFRTMLHEALPADGRPQRAVETWIRRFAPLRREWLDEAHRAVGTSGVTPLRVEAIAVTRAAVARLRHASAAREDLDAALGEAGPILSAYAAARRTGRVVTGAHLRRLSTRFDYCVVAALLAESGHLWADLSLATPLLCSEARIAAAKLRGLLEGRPAAGPGPGVLAGSRPA